MIPTEIYWRDLQNSILPSSYKSKSNNYYYAMTGKRAAKLLVVTLTPPLGFQRVLF